ncbi:MAG: hypothetical protein L6R28_06350 [Planctomycetes bacterium]|nr:hypothetical protein [Planctomycetota bacterium]
MFEFRGELDNRLVFGSSRSEEWFGLFFIGLGILTITVLVAGFSGEFEFTPVAAVVAPIFFYAVALGLVGIILLAKAVRIVFFKSERILFFKKGLKRERQWSFDEIDAVELVAIGSSSSVLRLRIKGQEPLVLASGNKDKYLDAAKRIAETTERPLHYLTSEEVRREMSRK